MVPIILDYTAEKEDEISVVKGERVQILAANQHQMYLVYKSASLDTPAAEGWIPGHVLASGGAPGIHHESINNQLGAASGQSK